MSGMGGGLTATYIETMVRERYATAERMRLVKLARRLGRCREAHEAAGWCDTGRTSPATSRHCC